MQGMEDRKLSSQPGRVQTPIRTGRKDETGVHAQGRKGVRRTRPPPLPFLTSPWQATVRRPVCHFRTQIIGKARAQLHGSARSTLLCCIEKSGEPTECGIPEGALRSACSRCLKRHKPGR